MDNLFYRRKKKAIDVAGLLRAIGRNKRLIILLVAGVPLGLYLMFGNRGVLQRIRLERQKTEMENQIRNAEAESKKLEAQSKALDGDKKAIEKVARERYGMARDGETVYKCNRKQ